WARLSGLLALIDLGELLTYRFRPAGRVTFVLAKVTKTARPAIRPRLRRGSFAPSSFQRPAAKGHPWPITALAASMPLNFFHDDSAHPPEGAIRASDISGFLS